MQTGVGVEKVSHRDVFSAADMPVRNFLLSDRLSGGGQNRGCRLAEKADQSLDVVRSRCHEELLANKL